MKRHADKVFGRKAGKKPPAAAPAAPRNPKEKAHKEFRHALDKPVKTITKFMTKRLKANKKDGEAGKYLTHADLEDQQE